MAQVQTGKKKETRTESGYLRNMQCDEPLFSPWREEVLLNERQLLSCHRTTNSLLTPD